MKYLEQSILLQSQCSPHHPGAVILRNKMSPNIVLSAKEILKDETEIRLIYLF